ncbi:DEAD/DEAH box helicase [Spirosoma spitsbergense]|uniref:DEAD/DEAH box helicase n=1 Tax=Spirosoma spitsbergense TaxID=431554 RepID=UPI00036CA75A|nr:DEAD/DEAH box helicase [Spirosoma spitsbergense]
MIRADVFCGISGACFEEAIEGWEALALSESWKGLIRLLVPTGSTPRPVQMSAINAGLLASRWNAIVAAPTNSGKSLVGLLPLFEALCRGKRAVLLEPLRVLAKEKHEYLTRYLEDFKLIFGSAFSIRISTGDYRLEDEKFSDAPPAGELLIATPERLEAILRNPANSQWFDTVGAVCVDEAHLLASNRRGLTLEFLITTLLCLPKPPRLILLSATLGKLQKLKQWLEPCEVIEVTERTPPLQKWVWSVSDKKEADAAIVEYITDKIIPNDHQALIFVYTTADTEKLANYINQQVKGPIASHFHAKISSAARDEVRESFIEGKTRVIVSTTALGMGVNLPASHVIVRDVTFEVSKPVPLGDLLQMMGRAGRGEQEGTAIAIVKDNDAWDKSELVNLLTSEALPDFIPASAVLSSSIVDTIASLVMAHLYRVGPTGKEHGQIQCFFERSLGGAELAALIPETVSWLIRQKLAYIDESKIIRLTNLGNHTAKYILPPSIAAGIAQLMRDILSLDEKDEYLQRWSLMDNLFLIHLLSNNTTVSVRYSDARAKKVDSWFESNPEELSIIYRNWVRGQEGFSRADEILGSLGVKLEGSGRLANEKARKKCYEALIKAIVLYELAKGKLPKDIEREYDIKNVEGVQEKWRDHVIWLLSGMAKLYKVPNFYFHLKEHCQADKDRVQRVENFFKKLEFRVYAGIEELKYCHPLGSLLHGIKRITNNVGAGIGIQTMNRLVENGITTYAQLCKMKLEDFTSIGIHKPQAKIITKYIQRRRLA